MFNIKMMSWNCSHDSSFNIDRPEGYDDYLMVWVKTKALFEVKGEQIITEPGTFIIYDRNSPHRYGAYGKNMYINAWMEFDTDEFCDVLPNVVFDVPIHINTIDVEQYFKLISDSFFRSNNVNTQIFLLKALLTDIFANSKNMNDVLVVPHLKELLELRKEVYLHPGKEWNVKTMSDKVYLSSAYFQEIYKSAFGVTCMSDVITSRIERAKTYLCDDDLSIEFISQKCGYRNAVHFSRQFKKRTNMTPSQWKSANV